MKHPPIKDLDKYSDEELDKWLKFADEEMEEWRKFGDLIHRTQRERNMPGFGNPSV